MHGFISVNALIFIFAPISSAPFGWSLLAGLRQLLALEFNCGCKPSGEMKI
ncbi:hypothetical protein CPter291_1839 [Collimonas pratensis]|uniref:Uncharacterized protein n=1 Tax=Collimonas pratensis TaxID=279113 RepID=A0ABM5Z4S3_9BURK|nr:hypothetical protein CPter291_1839 [Collimonas pratensis]